TTASTRYPCPPSRPMRKSGSRRDEQAAARQVHRQLTADGSRLTYTGGPYEDTSAGMVQFARSGTMDGSGLGRAAQVWRHAAYRLAWRSGVFQRQPGSRARRTGCLAGAQYVQLPTSTVSARFLELSFIEVQRGQ